MNDSFKTIEEAEAHGKKLVADSVCSTKDIVISVQDETVSTVTKNGEICDSSFQEIFD